MTVTAAPERILVIANRTCPCEHMLEAVRDLAGPRSTVLLVAPALNRRLAHWVSDSDAAVAAARDRLTGAVGYLRERGVEAEGCVGDADPLVAIHDALAGFAAEALVISSWPEGESNWLERNLLQRVRAELSIPVEHVVSHLGLPATMLR
ncbi:MAG: hypothetical protein ABIO51_02145 [Solirubrobacteraceae bacterium]